MVNALKLSALAAAGASLAAFLFVAAGRLVYPFELEWIEGGLVDEVRAVLSGAALYGPPSVHGVAFIYPPLYFYASAAAALVVGGGFLPLRLVSFASTGACFALVYAMARRAGAGWGGGLLAAGLFAATFKVGAGWLSLARVDALCLALLLAGAYLLQPEKARSPRSDNLARGVVTTPLPTLRHAYIASGLLFALSFLTKQSALPMALPLAAYAAYTDRRRGWLVAGSLAAAALAASALFEWATGGWYGFYVFTAALAQPLAGSAGSPSGLLDWLAPLSLAALAALAFLAVEWRARRPVGFWLALGLGTVGTTFWVQLHQGAVENNRLPVLALLAVLAGPGFERIGARAQPYLRSLAYGLCLLQFALLAYNPWHRLPTAANREAAQALVQRLSLASGEVLVPQHGGLAWLAGKPSGAHLAAIEDVFDAGGPPAAGLLDEMRAALRERRFAAIVVDGPDYARLFPELDQDYADAGAVAEGEAFYNVEGARTAPEILYVPKS